MRLRRDGLLSCLVQALVCIMALCLGAVFVMAVIPRARVAARVGGLIRCQLCPHVRRGLFNQIVWADCSYVCGIWVHTCSSYGIINAG